ncbi:MAG: alcohol dehydrogenase catalytic domain-containing protein [Streptosporangiaceae bacterium]
MLAAVTARPHTIHVIERPEPANPPPPGHVLVHPEAVGVCGSDSHIFTGDTAALSGAEHTYPRVQGHEISARVVAIGAGGADGPSDLAPGHRVAVWPLSSCGRCYPCRVGRPNACTGFRLVGVHTDGGLQELLSVPATQVFPAGDVPPHVVAFAEPTSIAIHAVRRARVMADEHVVVLGAGAIGQAVCLAALDLGAHVMAVDPVSSRRALAQAAGATGSCWGSAAEVAAAARTWSGGEGPQVVVDATGSATALARALETVGAAGRVVVVGMSADRAPFRSGLLPTKEVDVLGSSCCDGGEFAAAVDLVGRCVSAVGRLVSHRIPLAEADRAMELAAAAPEDVMKVLVTPGT